MSENTAAAAPKADASKPKLPAGLGLETLETLKKSHGELRLFQDSKAAILMKRPSRAQWTRFQSLMNEGDGKGSKRVQGISEIVSACTVWPPNDQLEALFDKFPAHETKFGMQFLTWVGGEDEVEKKDF